MFKGPFVIKSYEIEKRISILILLGTVFVLIFTLFGLALAELETEDSPFVEINRITRIRGTLSYRTLVSGFPVGVFALILLFEFLRGHIGEKRFAEKRLVLNGLIRLFEFLESHTGEKRDAEKANRVSFPFHIYPVFLTTARFGPSFVFMEAETNEHLV